MSVLFFHFDGTGNGPQDAFSDDNSDQSITNVLKSHLLLGGSLESDSGRLSYDSPNRSFYYAGIGTYGRPLDRWLNAGFAFEEADVGQILKRALFDFQCHYHVKVRHIVLIGFSRGAALARRFAALIHHFVPSGSVLEVVMDTVASFGWPCLSESRLPKRDVVFEFGGTLPKCVARTLHLVALDEQRLAFRPTLINHDGRVDEVWLSGVHSDVGGGFRRDGLADISYSLIVRWLSRQLQVTPTELYRPTETLLFLQQDPVLAPLWRELLETRPVIDGFLHRQQRGPLMASFTLAPRRCHVLKNDLPCPRTAPRWHRSVYSRMQQTAQYRPAAQLINSARKWEL